MTTFPFDTTRPVHLALRGGSHTFAMTYAPDGVPIVAVYVGDRLDEPACTMIRPDVARAMGALLATHAEMQEKAKALVVELRKHFGTMECLPIDSEEEYLAAQKAAMDAVGAFVTDFQLDD